MPHYFKRARLSRVSRIGPPLVLLIVLAHICAQTTAKSARGTSSAPARSGETESAGTLDPGTQIPGWVLKFDEEFDGNRLNYAKWSPHPPREIGIGGRQEWVADAITVSGGQAHITARKTDASSPPGRLESGIMTTYGVFAQTYGRFEIRFRIPTGRGLEPQFRLLPIPSGEIPSIDVLDAAGSDPTTALFANRWGDERADRDYTGSHKVADLSVGFHIVSVEWDKEKILWTVDGVERFHSFDGIPHQPMYLAVWLAVNTDKSGDADERTRFPAVFDIDYIRTFARP
jgi:beta-glucanase (GH16 family)